MKALFRWPLAKGPRRLTTVVPSGRDAAFLAPFPLTLLDLESQVVFWPDAEERRSISQRVERSYGFEGCVGFVDGTLFPVYARPSVNGEDFYSRKGFYGLAGMIVCDDRKLIRYMDVGWPGAVHDMRVWSNSALGSRAELFFSTGEFLLADSGYGMSDYILPAIKKPRGGNLSEKQ